MSEPQRETLVERSRREVQERIAKTKAASERAMLAKYNLLRVSERRWRIVRVSSVAETMFSLADVITFECVTKPLPFDEALAELKTRRTK